MGLSTFRHLATTGLLLLTLATVRAAPSAPRWLALPTANNAIFEGAPEKFFMYVHRQFEGQASMSFEGGDYGFCRTPQRINDRVVYTRFHEGIDIKPLRRNRRGEPLDDVYAAAAGSVVHVSAAAGNSNYGIYAVVEHVLQGSPYYTLYAHMATVKVKKGDVLQQGDTIGRVGYTGVGVDRERAHLHYEFCLMANRSFDKWYGKHFAGQPDSHGLHNGMNLMGLDPLQLTRAVLADPLMTVAQYIRGQTPLFRIVVAADPVPDILRLYPWLITSNANEAPAAWAITISNQLIPMHAEARAVFQGPVDIEWLGSLEPAPKWQSRGLIGGTAAAPVLTSAGERWIELLTVQ